MKIVFFGSDDFAEAHLRALIGSKHAVLACVTQPDRPKGRGMKVAASPVKTCAKKNGLPVLQPESLKDDSFVEKLKGFRADLFVVIAYGKILPEVILSIPPQGVLNAHAALLPKYRGAAPINWAVISGEKETGISIIQVDEKMDAGDVLAQKTIRMSGDENAVTLRAKMIKVGPPFLLNVLKDLPGCKAKKQDPGQVTFAPKLNKEVGHIDWSKSSELICNLVRGLFAWPAAYTYYNGKMLKILETQILYDGLTEEKPGTVLTAGKRGIVVATGDGRLLIKKVHLQDAKPMSAHSFVIGHSLKVGHRF